MAATKKLDRPRYCEVEDCPNEPDSRLSHLCSEHESELNRLDRLADAEIQRRVDERRGK